MMIMMMNYWWLVIMCDHAFCVYRCQERHRERKNVIICTTRNLPQMFQPLGNQAVSIREISRCIQQNSFKFGPIQIPNPHNSTSTHHTFCFLGPIRTPLSHLPHMPNQKTQRKTWSPYLPWVPSLVFHISIQLAPGDLNPKKLDNSLHWFITSRISYEDVSKNKVLRPRSFELYSTQYQLYM